MQYYTSQKELDPFHTSAIFIAPLWTQKRWFQHYLDILQLVRIFHTGQHAFLLQSDRLGKPAGELVDVGPLQWDVGVFYDAPRFSKSPQQSVARGKGLSATVRLLRYAHR